MIGLAPLFPVSTVALVILEFQPNKHPPLATSPHAVGPSASSANSSACQKPRTAQNRKLWDWLISCTSSVTPCVSQKMFRNARMEVAKTVARLCSSASSRNYSMIFDEGWYMWGKIAPSSVVAGQEAAMTEAVQSQGRGPDHPGRGRRAFNSPTYPGRIWPHSGS